MIDDETTDDVSTEDLINALDSSLPVNEVITGNMVVATKSDEAFCMSSKIHHIPLATANLNANVKLKITLFDNA